MKIISNAVNNKVQQIKSITINPSKKIMLKKLSQIKPTQNSQVVNLLILLIDLRNTLAQISRENIFVMVLNGNRNIRILYTIVMQLNSYFEASISSEEVKRVFLDESQERKILKYCIPHKHDDFLKLFIDAISPQRIDFKRAAIKELESKYQLKGLKILEDQNELSQKNQTMLRQLLYFVATNKGSLEIFYTDQVFPFISERHKIMKCQFFYIQKKLELLDEKHDSINKKKRKYFLPYLLGSGYTAIGFPHEPRYAFSKLLSTNKTWMYQMPKYQYLTNDQRQYQYNQQRRKRYLTFKKNLLKQFEKKYKKTEIDIRRYKLQIHYLQPNYRVYSQQKQEVIPLKLLPFFFGGKSFIFQCDLPFINVLDNSISGMNLSIEYLKPSSDKQEFERDLVIANNSCNGYSLRLKLGLNRKWQVSQRLIFQIDPPTVKNQNRETKKLLQNEILNQQDFDHFVYQVIVCEKLGQQQIERIKNQQIDDQLPQQFKSLQFYNTDQVSQTKLQQNKQQFQALKLSQITYTEKQFKNGLVQSDNLQDLHEISILIVDFKSKNVIDVIEPEQQFDAIEFKIEDYKNDQGQKIYCLIMKQSSNNEREYQFDQKKCVIDENIWVYARDVPYNENFDKRFKQYIDIPIQYWVTCFKINILDQLLKDRQRQRQRQRQRRNIRSINNDDILSFGRQCFQIKFCQGDIKKRKI